MLIVKRDSDGVKPLLQTGELGYDNYPAGGDSGRVYVGTGSVNIPLAKKAELNAKADKTNAGLLGVPTAPTAAVGTNSTQLATTAFVGAEIADKAYSKTQLNAGQLDNRYYTETEINTLYSATVKLTGDQTVAGIKTFSSNIAGSITGNSGTATKLATARTIGGVSFDGTANINLPGVNAAGNQNTTGNAGSATKLATARTINGVAFDGSANITVSDTTAVKLTGDQTISGTKTFSGLSKTSIGDNALEVITSGSNAAAGSFMVSQGAKYGLALNGSGTGLGTGKFIFQVIDRDSKTVQSIPLSIGIDGVVSYSFFPVTPSSAPTANYQVANKKYVDDTILLLSPNDNRVKTALNATGNAPIYACRAWVNFNGTGTVAISASGNVSSITDKGVGDYIINFTTAMPDTNFSVSGICNEGLSTNIPRVLNEYGDGAARLTTQVPIVTVVSGTDVHNDMQQVNVSIFR